MLSDVLSASDVRVPSPAFDEFLTVSVEVWPMPGQVKVAVVEAGDEAEPALLVDVIDADASGHVPQVVLPTPAHQEVSLLSQKNEEEGQTAEASLARPAVTESTDMPILSSTHDGAVRVDPRPRSGAAEGMTAQRIDSDGDPAVLSSAKGIEAPTAKSKESTGQPVSILADITVPKVAVSDRQNDPSLGGDSNKSVRFQTVDEIRPGATIFNPSAGAVAQTVVGFATTPQTSSPRADLRLHPDDQSAVGLHAAKTVPIVPPLIGAISGDMIVAPSAIDQQVIQRALAGQRQGSIEGQEIPISNQYDKNSLIEGITSTFGGAPDSIDLWKFAHSGLPSESGVRSDLMTTFAPARFGVGDTQAESVQRPPVAPPVAGSVAQQIAVTINQAAERTVELALNPAELGRVRMTLTAQDQGMMIHVLTERPETSDLMRRHVDVLQQELRALGYTSVKLDFDAGGAAHDRARGQPEHLQNASEIGTVSSSNQPIQPQPTPIRIGGLDLRL
ncbi:hypothetical protein AN189_00490 [Loktanella sp. 3ANDIMAR09]|nr:hypothetical protein AN189_00490 [Loktanella sp. 3ANDIMAR09]